MSRGMTWDIHDANSKGNAYSNKIYLISFVFSMIINQFKLLRRVGQVLG